MPNNFLGNQSVLCCRKFPIAKKFLDKRGGGYQDFVSNFFVSQSRKVSQEIPLILDTSGYRKMLGIKERGRIHESASKLFCLTVLKLFVEEPFSAVFQIFSCSEQVHGKERAQYKDFPTKISCLTVPKIVVGESFSVSLIWGIEKIYG